MHAGAALAAHDLFTAWSVEPGIVVPLLFTGALYAAGVMRLWRRAGRGHGVTTRQVAAFAAGWMVLAVALVSPLHALGEVLLSAHMTQHVLLMLVAAPLLVLGSPLVAMLWSFEPGGRRRIGRIGRSEAVRHAWRWLTTPAVAWTIHAAAVWAWHMPRWYAATLSSETVHALQHLSFLGTALLFWWVLVDALRHQASTAVGVVYVFTTALHTGALGALMTFSPVLWYKPYAASAGAWGLSPLEDQQLAGVIMWIPGGVVYLAAALLLVASLVRGGATARAAS